MRKKAFENIVGKGENAFPTMFSTLSKTNFSVFLTMCPKVSLSWSVRLCIVWLWVNPLPHKPISGSSNSAANKDMMSEILTNWDSIF